MWGLFNSKPECPIDPEREQWVDERFRWLEEQLGPETPRKVDVILPTLDYFPDQYNERPEDAQSMLIRIAGYMNLDPQKFDLFFYSEAGPAQLPGPSPQTVSGSAGVYVHAGGASADGRRKIGIESAQLKDPMSLVATLAHELGHEILLGQNRISADEPDHEPLTDLLTVFMGLGLFTANATIRDRGWSSGGWSGWRTSRHGYLDQRMLGYALARFAFVRGEARPRWMRHLRPDVLAPLKLALRYVFRGGG